MKKKEKSKYNVGGEAVIEGVMMRSPHYYAIAVRRANKKIVTTHAKIDSLAHKYAFLKWPIFRGILSMFESMSLGMKALMFSADEMEKDILIEDAKHNKGKKKVAPKKKNETLENFVTFGIAIVMAILLFIMLPWFITKGLSKISGFESNRYSFNIGMVFFKLLIFFLYVWGISFFEDVKRLFQYHGAEHKCIYVFEAGEKITFQNTLKFSPRHPRCGTAFIIITLIVSLILFVIFLPPGLKLWQRILWEIPLLLPVIGLSY